MKRIWLSLFFVASLAWGLHAYEPVWLASHTLTVDTIQILCPGKSYLVGTSTTTTGNRGILHEICVNDPTSASGFITVYNSSSTAVNAYVVLTATTGVNAVCTAYDVTFSSGLVYSTTKVNDITFVYQCY